MQKNQKNIKIVINRKKLSSKKIKMKQDFSAIIDDFNEKKIKSKMSYTPLFYGVIGLSFLLLLFSVV